MASVVKNHIQGLPVASAADNPPNCRSRERAGASFPRSESFSAASLGHEFTRLYNGRFVYTLSRRRIIERYFSQQERNIERLAESLQKRSYRPTYRGTLIEQQNDDGTFKKNRGITPLAPADWMVQRLLLRELTDLCGYANATHTSWGRRSQQGEADRSPANCCKAIAEARKTLPAAFRADLVDFFPSVDREVLKSAIAAQLPSDWRWHWLLESLIDTDAIPPKNATAAESAKFWPPGKGVPQGTVLAPFFANTVMSAWDDQWSACTKVFRYVDDWLVLGASGPALESLSKQMVAMLPKGVTCHLGNTAKCDFFGPDQGISFLGLTITPSCSVRPSSGAFTRHKTTLRERARLAENVVGLTTSLVSFNEAWKAYYKRAGLSEAHANAANNAVSDQIEMWLAQKGIHQHFRGPFRKLLLDYKPAPQRNQDLIDTAVSSGEIHPSEIDKLIARIS